MKKTIATLLIFGVAFILNSASVFALEDPFSDTSEQYMDAVTYLADRGIIQGYEDGTVRLDNNINRAEVTKILAEGNGVTPDVAEYNNCFDDVIDDWYAPYVCYAQEQGWVQGYADGTFKPAQTIKKAEVIKLILVSQGYDIPEDVGFIPYEDVSTSQWYAAYVQVASDHNLLEEEGSILNPAENMNRGGAFEILFRTLVINELDLSEYYKPATDSLFGRGEAASETVQNLRIFGENKDIDISWDEYPGEGNFNSYAIMMKKGADFADGDLIEPIYVDLAETSYTFENMDDGTYFIKVGLGDHQTEPSPMLGDTSATFVGTFSETQSITLKNKTCQNNFANFDPNQGSHFSNGETGDFMWNGTGCSNYEFQQYMLCFDQPNTTNYLCLGAFTNHYELSDNDWMLLEQQFGTGNVNLEWYIKSTFESDPNTQTLETDPWSITLNI